MFGRSEGAEGAEGAEEMIRSAITFFLATKVKKNGHKPVLFFG